MTRQRTASSILEVAVFFITLLAVSITLAAIAAAQNPVPFLKRSPESFTSRPGERGKARPNDSSSLFLPAIAYANGNGSVTTLAMADVNGDGKLDLLVGNESSVGVMLGNGDGTFQAAQCWGLKGKATCGQGNPIVQFPTSIAVADLNGDGKPDLVVTFQYGPGPEPVGVMLGNGDGTFQPLQLYNSGGVYATGIAVADMNGDGKPDLVVANLCAANNGCDNGASVSVLLGNGNGTFQAAQSFSSGGNFASSVAVADVNGDGKPDILVTNGEGSTANGELGNVGVLLGNGNGTFQPVVTYSSGTGAGLTTTSEDIVVADVSGDGKLDLVVSSQCLDSSCDQGAISVLLGNGDGTFQAAQTYSSGGYGANTLTLGDVNSDGILDVLVANDCAIGSGCLEGFQSSSNGILGVLVGNGNGTFQPAQTYNTGGWGGSTVVAGDLTGDGELDAVVSDGCGDTCVGVVGVVGVLLSNNGEPSTTTTLVSSANSVTLNQTVTYTATVVSTSGEPITGTVSFDDAWTSVATISLSAGQAAYTTSYSIVGTHPITAVYSGDANNAESSSNTLIESAAKGLTKTTITSSPNPSSAGQSVTFTAAVTSTAGSLPNGEMVTFYNSSAVLGTGSLSAGIATLTTSSLPLGTFTITATYRGDANFAASTSPTLLQVVNSTTKYATSTALVSNLNPSIKGEAITFTATVTSTGGTPPNGETVTFYNGLNIIGTAPISGGVASLTTTSLPTGIYAISAAYLGDFNFTASTSPALQQVVDTKTQSPTMTALTSSLNPSIYGQKVTWTATIATTGSIAATGKVSFTWGSGNSIGSATLNASGIATLTLSNLSAALYPLTAIYNGDANNGPSVSPILNQTITQTISTATLTSSPNPSTQGQSVTFTAKITSPTTTPTGPVTFTAGKTVLGSVEITSGKATFTTSTLPAGSNTITVTYPWNSDIAESSASLTQVVQP